MKTSEIVGFLDLNNEKSKIADPKFTKTTEDGNECNVHDRLAVDTDRGTVPDRLAVDTDRGTVHEWLQHCMRQAVGRPNVE